MFVTLDAFQSLRAVKSVRLEQPLNNPLLFAFNTIVPVDSTFLIFDAWSCHGAPL